MKLISREICEISVTLDFFSDGIDPETGLKKVKEEHDPEFDYSAEFPKPLEANLPCQYCGRKFKLQNKLDAHIAKSHPDPNSAKEELKIKCGFCELMFKTRKDLTCVSSAKKPIFIFF